MRSIERWTLPLIVDPPERLCVLVDVPNDKYHIAAFLGAIYTLTWSQSWQRDEAHTAALVSRVWTGIFDTLRLRLCSDFDCPITIEEWVEEMSLCDNIRFNADGKLQVLCCGQWVNVDGQPGQGIGGPGQPGSGSGVPAPGGCQTYHAVLNGNDQWLCPAVVNAGDSLQISNLQGAWSDGAGLWYCPTGKVFFAGNCTIQTLDALDPIPSAGHMALLSKIAGTFTDVSAGGLITVPGGVTNALLIFQANDPTLSDNGGQITFDIEVCNNQAVSWSHTFDFSLSNQGWQLLPIATKDSGTNGAWVPGSGWEDTDWHQTSPEWFRGVFIELTGFGTAAIDSMSIEYDMTKGAFSSGGELGVGIAVSVAGTPTWDVLLLNPSVIDGNGQIANGGSPVSGVDTLLAIAICSTSTPGNTLSGSSRINSVTVHGHGPQPVWP